VHGLSFALAIRLALCLHLLARRCVIGATRPTTTLRGTAKRRHRLKDVRGDCFLIHGAAFAFFATSAAALLLLLVLLVLLMRLLAIAIPIPVATAATTTATLALLLLTIIAPSWR
jgi:hypothetical protein